ncbi:hypothetical protein EG834_16165 [bacterium]|nr:hypothetical protein [bacterium]
MVDILRFDRVLNGNAVRSMHSINNGVYGGENIYRWDAKDQRITMHYFTTAGFMTQGRVWMENGKLCTEEEILGTAGGVTKVRGTMEFKPDGSLHVKTEQLRDSGWNPGHEVIYVEDETAKVVFK